jgi:hypothetical protein
MNNVEVDMFKLIKKLYNVCMFLNILLYLISMHSFVFYVSHQLYIIEKNKNKCPHIMYLLCIYTLYMYIFHAHTHIIQYSSTTKKK